MAKVYNVYDYGDEKYNSICFTPNSKTIFQLLEKEDPGNTTATNLEKMEQIKKK